MDGHISRAVAHKKPVPEIDFTLHTMEDGTQVSTQERVCKGSYQNATRGFGSNALRRCAGTRNADAH
jgi:hypothetical protein